MMKNDNLYFIGIKGTGMAALAQICLNLGSNVSGSDIPRHLFTEDDLRKLNIPIFNFDKDNIKNGMKVIIGNAFDQENPEVRAAIENETVETFTYHEFIGELMQDYRSIAISGSHGKTTTTTLLKDMLASSKNTGYLIGDGRGFLKPEDEYFLLEACEYRRHFLAYQPEIAIMTNFEIDHVDYFKNEQDYLSAFEDFSKNIKELLIVWGDDPHFHKMNFHQKMISYGFSDKNDLHVKNMIKNRSNTVFDVYFKNEYIYTFDLPLVGDHMILNSLAVIAVGIYENMELSTVEQGLKNFKGALRRFVIEEGKENVYIDDYAHHPTEINVTIQAAKTRYPDKKIVAVFKGYRVSRLSYFLDDFAKSLMQADEVCLCPLNSVNDFEEGVEFEIEDLQAAIPGSFIVDNDEEGLDILEGFGPAVYVFMSPKDIYELKDALKERYND